MGREAELAQLHGWLDKTLKGERQLVFVTGEPGIGKTSLIKAFLSGIRGQGSGNGTSAPSDPRSPTPDPWIAWGQCVEQYGTGEAYLPVLEALGRLCRSEAGPALKAVLEQYAPTWLLHLPALVSAEEATALQPRVLGVLPERMLRELAEALEVLTTTQPLILVFEDLHWADASTLALLSALARRHEPARLLILGTYRNTEATRAGSPLSHLIRDLAEHGLSREVAVTLLDEHAIAAYLVVRFPLSLLPTRFASVLQQRTGGNPLFVVSILQDLIARAVITQSEGTWTFNGEVETLGHETPDGIRQLVISQGMRLQAETHRVLAAASVAGMEFSAAEVAAALETAVPAVEERCARLIEQQLFLRPAGVSEWPDHTVSARYAFRHAVYQTVWHEQVSPARLQEWHRRMGERKEVAYGEWVGEIAAALAVHFEQGRQYDKEVRYLQQAAEIALRRSANPEAIHYLQKALAALQFLPDTPERSQQELTLQITLSTPLVITRGHSAPEVEATYERALALCRTLGATPQLFSVLLGTSRFYMVRSELHTASHLGEELLRLAHDARDPDLVLLAYMRQGGTLFFRGDFVAAQTHAEHGLTLYDPERHRALIFLHGEDPEVSCLAWRALALWHLGYPNQALDRIYQTRQRAQEVAHPLGLVFTLFWTAFAHQCRGEVRRAQEQTDILLAQAQELESPQHVALGIGLRGWVLAEQGHREEGVAQIQQGLAGLRAIGQELGRPYYLALLAEAYGKGEQVEEGMKALTEALAITHTGGEYMHQAELYRLAGELLLRRSEEEKGRQGERETFPHSPDRPFSPSSPEECFQNAIEIARKQQAKSLELRAVMSLVRLRQRQAQDHATCNTQHSARAMLADAHTMLSEIYHWFTEGFDTKDLQEAKALIEELSH